MSKIRVYELAKLLGKSNPELVELLKEMGVEIKTHMSSIDMDTAQRVEDALAPKTQVSPGAEGKATKSETSDRAAVRAAQAPEVLLVDGSATVGDIAKKLGA